jgi:hypothetical protein
MNKIKSRKTPLGLRVAALALGVALLVWLPFEDQNVIVVIIFAAALCVWFAVRYLWFIPPAQRRYALRCLLVGAAAGLALAPMAILLMIAKSGLHGHDVPDFTLTQITSILWRAPLWTIGGALVGFGGGLWRQIQLNEP